MNSRIFQNHTIKLFQNCYGTEKMTLWNVFPFWPYNKSQWYPVSFGKMLSSKYLLFSTDKRKAYRFRASLGTEFSFFVWTILLISAVNVWDVNLFPYNYSTAMMVEMSAHRTSSQRDNTSVCPATENKLAVQTSRFFLSSRLVCVFVCQRWTYVLVWER